MLTEEERRIIDETRQDVQTVKTVLLGANGDRGLVGKVDDVCSSHYSFKNRVYLLGGVLAGIGILVGGGYGLFQIFG